LFHEAMVTRYQTLTDRVMDRIAERPGA